MIKNNFVEKTIQLYGGMGWKSLFTKIRFWDAPFVEVEKLIPRSGRIVDLGCGEGIFTNFLALSSDKRKIIGIEIDKTRVKEADHQLNNVTFKWGDATTYTLPPTDCIILFHLLHHLNNFEDQSKVIERCAKALKKGGKLIVVEVNPTLSIKFVLAFLTDHFLVPWAFERRFYSPIFFRKDQEWKKLLENCGLSCKILKADQDKPFSHIILQCQKN